MEQPLVLLIPIASWTHRERAAEPSKRARELLEEVGLKVFGPQKPITKLEEAPKTTERFDATVVFVAGGGSAELATYLVKDRKALIWAYHENNSLPSALSARERLVAEKAWQGQILYNNLTYAPKEIVAEAQATRLLRNLKEARIGLVGDEEDLKTFSLDIEMLKAVFGIEIALVSIDRLKEEWTKAPEDEAEKIVNARLAKFEVVEPSKRDIIKATRLYLALKQIVKEDKLDVITFECFRFLKRTGALPCIAFSLLNDEEVNAACEADLRAATLMFIFRLLTGKPSWIANLVQVDSKLGAITLSHCTAAISLAEPGRNVIVRSHFESGQSASLDVPLKRNFVTLVNMQTKPTKLTVTTGEVIDSQMGHLTICRTQAKIKPTGKIEPLIEQTGNHQVLAYGDWSDLFLKLADKTGIIAVKV